MQTYCQWALVVQLTLSFFMFTYYDINGRPERPPLGFPGFVGTCTAVIFNFGIVYGSGALNGLFGN